MSKPADARSRALSARRWNKPLPRTVAADDAPPGTVYCRVLDLYVDPQTKARAEALHFTQAHRALCA
jgi:hypothetical protein